MRSIHWPLFFSKMNGAGNDFIIIDHRQPRVAPHDMPEFARLVCRRQLSVGADGVFFLESSTQADFKWRFFNADGSEAEMCGNGARCVARFAFLQGLAGSTMSIETLAGIVAAEVAADQVSVRMTPPHSFRLRHTLELDGAAYCAHLVNTGVPHLVVVVDGLASVNVARLGRRLRFHPDFGPQGVNVNFVSIQEDCLRLRTYERGVEAETMACGTGATAVALIAAELGLASSPVRLIPTSGAELTVDFARQSPGCFDKVRLGGPAQLVYQAELNPESLLP